MGPEPVTLALHEANGRDALSFVVTNVPEGSVVEKWDVGTNSWVTISNPPPSASPHQLLQYLNDRVIQPNDNIRWRPRAGIDDAAAAAFELVNWQTGNVVGAPAPPAPPPANSATQSPNLLLNPGAEFGDSSPTGNGAVTIPGWRVTGTPTVISYGLPRNSWPIGTSFPFPNLPASMGFPTAAHGPTDGGNQFFGGGNVADSTISQTVDLNAASAEIDQGGVSFNLSGWLGGWLWNPSEASLEVTFFDNDQTAIGNAVIGPVSKYARLLQTGLMHRETSGLLPVGTRSARVTITFDQQSSNDFAIKTAYKTLSPELPPIPAEVIAYLVQQSPSDLGINAAYNNAFADNISFTISADLPAPAYPTPPVSVVGELDHVFLVYVENKGYNDILGSPNAPFLNSLIDTYGFANNYYGVTHGSLPNYYPIVGGSTFITYNAATAVIDSTPTLASNIDDAGLHWRAYAQSLEPGADPLVPTHDYGAADQVAFLAFTSIANDPDYVREHILPLEQMAGDLADPATAPNFAWLFANEDNCGEGPVDTPEGMLRFGLDQLSPTHQYNVPALDNFLRETIPVIMISPTWLTTKSVIVVTFDEDNNNMSLGFGNEGNHVVTVVIASPKAVAEGGMIGGHVTATSQYDHYSLLRTIEDSLGLPYLNNNDRYATPMNEFWTAGKNPGVG